MREFIVDRKVDLVECFIITVELTSTKAHLMVNRDENELKLNNKAMVVIVSCTLSYCCHSIGRPDHSSAE